MGDGHAVGAEVDSDAFSTASADTRAAVAGTDGAASGDTDRHVHSTLADADVDPKTSSAARAEPPELFVPMQPPTPPPNPMLVSVPLCEMVQPNPWPLPEPWLLPDFFHGNSGQESLLLPLLIMALELVLPYLRGKCLALAERGR